MLAPATNVRVAHVGGDLVFLDLARDAYLSVGADIAGPARAALEGRAARCDEIVNELVGAEFLVPCPSASSPYLDRALPIDCPEPSDARFRLGEFLRLCAAAIAAARLIRVSMPCDWPGIANPILAVPPLDAELFDFASRFGLYRCLLPKTGRCLVQSMILTRALRARGFACDWVFGVRTHPFAAHCWVEARGFVLNDVADHVAWYVPIAVL